MKTVFLLSLLCVFINVYSQVVSIKIEPDLIEMKPVTTIVMRSEKLSNTQKSYIELTGKKTGDGKWETWLKEKSDDKYFSSLALGGMCKKGPDPATDLISGLDFMQKHNCLMEKINRTGKRSPECMQKCYIRVRNVPGDSIEVWSFDANDYSSITSGIGEKIIEPSDIIERIKKSVFIAIELHDGTLPSRTYSIYPNCKLGDIKCMKQDDPGKPQIKNGTKI